GTIAGTQVIRAYELTYEDDPDTSLPRLSRVDRWGEGWIGGVAVPDAPGPFAASLPVATYEYGAVTHDGAITFESAGTVERNFHGADYADELSGSHVSRFEFPVGIGDGW